MSRIWQIALRELRAYFFSPIAYIVLTSFLVLNGLIFWLILGAFNRPDAPTGSIMQLFLGRTVFFWFFQLLFTAAITMRLFAEERRSGTLEILMTAPVTDTEAVVGKFLGAFFFYVALWAPTLIYVLILRRFSPLDMGPIASGYLYILLSGGMFLALGLLVSIMTRSQIVAAIVSFVFMFLLFLVPVFLEQYASGVVRDALAYANTWSHSGDFGKGLVDSRALVYYTTAIGFFLFLSVRTLAAKRGR
jgi:ABC-2 type transport system permease protein